MGRIEAVSNTGLLIDSLNKIRGVNSCEDRDGVDIFSNDLGVEKIIPLIKKELKINKKGTKIGIVVGPGGLLSLGTELENIDIWVLIDKNKIVIEKMKSLVEKIKFEEPQKIMGDLSRHRVFSTEHSSYGKYHYLDSPDNLEKSKSFLRKNNVVFLSGDFLNKEFMDFLGSRLNEYCAKVKFLNLSNLFSWVGDSQEEKIFKENLALLPIKDKTVFMFSRYYSQFTNSTVYCSIEIGLENYLKDENKQPIFRKAINPNYFRPRK